MIRLTSTSEKLRAVLAGAVTANQLHCTVSYCDKTSAGYNGDTKLTATNNTTAVDICSAPAASTIRDVDYVCIRNRDTASATITISLYDGSTDYEQVKVTLAAGDVLTYVHGHPWEVMNSSGEKKTVGSGSSTDEKAKVSSNDTTAGYLNGKLVAGSNITLTENSDGGNETLTIAASGGGSYTDEEAQDAVGTILADSATIDFTYTDLTPEITAIVKDDSITDAKLRNSGACSVIGRAGNSTGDPADISAGSDDTVLVRQSSTLSFTATPNCNARVAVRKNSGITTGTRRAINFIEGANVTLTVADDNANEEVEVTIAASSGGVIVDRAYAETTTHTTTTTTIPLDDTIPQNTEGLELLTVSLTPKAATNRVRITFLAQVGSSSTYNITAALFVDSTADALCAIYSSPYSAGAGHPLALRYEYSPGDTSAHTWKIRIGGSGGTTYVNGSSSRFFGGVARATLIVEEIDPV